MKIRPSRISSRYRHIIFFLAGISLFAGIAPAIAQDVYLCVWRNPERTMKKLFPDAEGYLTVETGISGEQKEEIESRLGLELLPGQQDRFLYFTMTDADGADIGTVIAASQKGQYGAIEFIFGLDTEMVEVLEVGLLGLGVLEQDQLEWRVGHLEVGVAGATLVRLDLEQRRVELDRGLQICDVERELNSRHVTILHLY